MAVTTVSASAGPNAASVLTRATTRPAVRMIGVNSAVVRRAARRRGSPSASRLRMPARKNTE